MKITAILLMLWVLLLPNAPAQKYRRWALPEGAVARLGKGNVEEVLYSPDGARFAVVSSIGIWLYDTKTYRAVALLAGHTSPVESIVFSPDGGGTCQCGSARYDPTVGHRDRRTEAGVCRG